MEKIPHIAVEFFYDMFRYIRRDNMITQEKVEYAYIDY